MIGVQSSLIVLPMNVLIVYLFRQAKPSSLDKKHKEKKKVEKLHQVVPPRKEDELYDVTLRHSIGMDIPSQKKRNKSSFVSTSFLRNTTKDSTQTFQGSSLFQIKESPEEVVWQVRKLCCYFISSFYRVIVKLTTEDNHQYSRLLDRQLRSLYGIEFLVFFCYQTLKFWWLV